MELYVAFDNFFLLQGWKVAVFHESWHHLTNAYNVSWTYYKYFAFIVTKK